MCIRRLFNFYFRREHLYYPKDAVALAALSATGSFAVPEIVRAENWSRQLTGWAFIDTHPLRHITCL
jgi:hypothetical protein